jgi:hypothetical protein
MRARPLLIAVGTGFLAGAAASGFDTYCRYRAYRSDGDVFWLWNAGFFLAAVLLAVPIVLFVSLLCLLLRRLRPGGVVGLLFSATLLIGFVLTPRADSFRVRGMRTIISNGKPLIAAIHRYHAVHGAWPPDLRPLVPTFLPAIPQTGLAAFPAFDYVVGPDASNQYHGNPWVVRVSTPSGGINWDQLIYYPRQNYPRIGHGGYLEPIQDWAYVHE